MKKLFFALILLCIGSFAYGAEKDVIVATLIGDPPWVFETTNYTPDKITDVIPPGADSQIIQGYSWDIVRESLHEMGYTIHLRIYPWARAMEATKNGEVDVLFPTSLKKERLAYFDYSKEPTNPTNFLIYVREDSTIKWDSLDSLNGLVIGEVRSWDYGAEWDKHTLIKKYQVNDILQGFRMLDAKRLDGLAGYEYNFDYALKLAKWPTTYKKFPTFASSVEYAAGPKNNPRVTKILNDFDIGKKRIIQNGKFAKIQSKWGIY